ncbi:hypothetical protein [Rhodococcus sp. IEGM 1408]|uniref:hypothetical protein n=1 Tax=Rhodococcus sp. IEGM 1408 TaxID=3082220 RepID=UPI002955ABE0|nr:hypothetical protein [Rhodococcus sp. IEGM 1408]MDV7999673.1 hypothetical protein [Rhodococcus sp. IEGM 1408]
METQRPRPLSGERVARMLVALSTAMAVSACSALGLSEPADSGPPRISPNPLPEVAAAMVEGRSAPDTRLNACELLDLTTARVIALTGADMPEVEPTGSGDLGMLCTYGGPGSPERYVAQQAEDEAAVEAESAAETAAGAGATEESAEESEPADSELDPDAITTATTTAASTTTRTATEAPESTALVPDDVPDSFAAGVVKPPSGSRASLAGQAAMLGVRYACSEIRGEDAGGAEGAAPPPQAPAPVRPEPDTAYIDCVAAPTGGGVEVHTILVADNDLWHITFVSPGTPRSPETDARALAGLHRVAEHILA